MIELKVDKNRTVGTVLLVPLSSDPLKYRLYIHAPEPVFGFQFQITGGILSSIYVQHDYEMSFIDEDSVFVLDTDREPFPGRGIICQLNFAEADEVRLWGMVFADGYGGTIEMPEEVE